MHLAACVEQIKFLWLDGTSTETSMSGHHDGKHDIHKKAHDARHRARDGAGGAADVGYATVSLPKKGGVPPPSKIEKAIGANPTHSRSLYLFVGALCTFMIGYFVLKWVLEEFEVVKRLKGAFGSGDKATVVDDSDAPAPTTPSSPMFDTKRVSDTVAYVVSTLVSLAVLAFVVLVLGELYRAYDDPEVFEARIKTARDAVDRFAQKFLPKEEQSNSEKAEEVLENLVRIYTEKGPSSKEGMAIRTFIHRYLALDTRLRGLEIRYTTALEKRDEYAPGSSEYDKYNAEAKTFFEKMKVVATTMSNYFKDGIAKQFPGVKKAEAAELVAKGVRPSNFRRAVNMWTSSGEKMVGVLVDFTGFREGIKNILSTRSEQQREDRKMNFDHFE